MKKSKITWVLLTLLIAAIVFVSVKGLGGIRGAADIRFGIDIRGGVEAVFTPKDYTGTPTADELESSRTIIESRLDAMNILDREVTVDRKSGNILVRFPWKSGETKFNPEAAIDELGAMAKLTFRDEAGKVLVEGKNVKKSSPELDPKTKAPVVGLSFDEEGAKLFAAATQANVGKTISIYMDETLISQATVNEAIPSGEAVISGKFTAEETKLLAGQINSGALPYAMETKSFSTISPSLASDALRVMILAGLLALFCICVFMISRYRLAGVVSSIALLFQLAVQILAVSIPQITLTLPGIAGMILSIGMGVDANIIISERISDELRSGKTIGSAITAGYHNAFAAVLDGNLTTLIVALLLIAFGSGTMLSFGYTLTVGLVMNFVAGVFTTRLMLQSLIEHPTFRNPSWFRLGREPKMRQFYQKRRIAYVLSGLIIVSGLVVSLVSGVALDTQFKGGVVLKYSYNGTVDSDRIERLAADQFGVPATAQLADELSGQERKLVVTLAQNTGITPQQQSEWTKTLETNYPDAALHLTESFAVEPYIGQAARNNAIIAIVLAGFMIVLYIWLRFRRISGLSAGVMALVALLHDAFVVFAAFSIARFPIGDAFVAVVLTIIGYSINDTIVIYDRIRENRKKSPKLPVTELVNQSISQTMTRSIYTSATTLASVFFMIVFSLWYGIDSVLYFALPMGFGLISGCYSTICIAGPLWASWQNRNKHKKEIAGT